ncbi:hypothetical protein [Mesorhizobium caraganae]|uniref:hypothetical protein n=1 Tax=Mesorhizobium caraganae TaxID=483206 RepID=UPI00177D28D6|nr:hypothetical protein [Mesorhizobium caraganae]
MEPNFDPFDTNAWMHQYAALQEQQRARQQSNNRPAGQASLERQLSNLQLSSSDERSGDASSGVASSPDAGSPDARPAEAHGNIPRTDVDGSMRMPPQSNLQDNWFSSTRYSVDIPRAHLGSAATTSQSDLRDHSVARATQRHRKRALRRGRRIAKAVDCFLVLNQGLAKSSEEVVAKGRPVAAGAGR